MDQRNACLGRSAKANVVTMVRKQTVNAFQSGVHNNLDKELIPKDAAADALGWVTTEGRIELMYGRQPIGGEGTAGRVIAQHIGYKTDGTAVQFRKIWDTTEGKVQYLNGSTWTDVITGLPNSQVTFTNYASLSGNYVYIGGPQDGLFKIVTANPGSYADVYDSNKNFKGYNFIDKGRMVLWGAENDESGLYGSHIDAQDSDVYTTVASEAIGSSGSTNYTGTLAFKSGGATRSCFGVTFTDGTTTLTVGYDGVVDDESTGSGTVNFMTGAYDITFDATTTGAVTADYQWEDSNVDGVTDFTKSATRLAGEGFVVRQDAGGDPIRVVIPYEGSYFSIKKSSVYQFTPDIEDENPTNQVIRTGVGVETLAAAVGTSAGILFVDTGNPSDPILTQLKRNPFGDNFMTEPIMPQFDFSKYDFSDVAAFNWDKYMVIACKEKSTENNRVLLVDMRGGSVDIAPYDVRCFSTDDGFLYAGSPTTQTSYEMFTGFDDVGGGLQNYWESKADTLTDPVLKKVKKYRFRGRISPDQSIEVQISTDNGQYTRVGTILGTGDYVDYNSTFAIGTTFIGESVVGGGQEATVYPFLMEIKVRQGKFRTRQLKFVAKGIGYCAIQEMTDFDVWLYQEKIPRNYRLKQNVSLDGETVNQDDPEY